ncbi:MAG: ATP-dependent sacrificial sulfur transferase LarE [Candidatus Heimdallarchaeota archaeon]|nr:ATP-dependent sacrificial sulfur transferase LarE [Candidatus Heimdallarchaeota archaeon]
MTKKKDLEEKYQQLQELLLSFEKVIVAFSGGVDSTFLTAVAYRLLGKNAIAITIASPLIPSEELAQAKNLAKKIGISHKIITKDIDDHFKWFETNPPNRCYLCKKSSLQLIINYCKENKYEGVIIEGSNFSDLDDYRPGMKAVQELQGRSPLLEVGLTKKEIRALAKENGIPVWDKPSSPCLATRFPFGEKITQEKLAAVFHGEEYLKSLGFKQVRLRMHGQLARIEVDKKQIRELAIKAPAISEKLKVLGFKFITIDLEGYKRGSMNISD